MVQIFAYFEHVQNVRKLEPTKIFARCTCIQSAMALYWYLKPLNKCPYPYNPLSSTVSPAAIKHANTAMKNCADSSGKPRGAYVKFTPETQAAIAKYASFTAIKPLSNVSQKNWGKRQTQAQSSRGKRNMKLS